MRLLILILIILSLVSCNKKPVCECKCDCPSPCNSANPVPSTEPSNKPPEVIKYEVQQIATEGSSVFANTDGSYVLIMKGVESIDIEGSEIKMDFSEFLRDFKGTKENPEEATLEIDGERLFKINVWNPRWEETKKEMKYDFSLDSSVIVTNSSRSILTFVIESPLK